jgi:hypothetical protein
MNDLPHTVLNTVPRITLMMDIDVVTSSLLLTLKAAWFGATGFLRFNCTVTGRCSENGAV